MRPVFLLFGVTCLAMQLCAQQTFTWQQLEDKFEATNPTLKAAQLSIDESRAAEITAYLRPNPDFSLTADGFQIARQSRRLASAQRGCGNARDQLPARAAA